MPYTIAITGKGGVGKTTLGALLVHRLMARGCRARAGRGCRPEYLAGRGVECECHDRDWAHS